MRYFFIATLILTSCQSKKGVDNPKQDLIVTDSLSLFPINYYMEFIGTNSNDQIAIHFKRETSTMFSYRIELLRKWKGLPLDYGKVEIKEIDGDSIYIFSGGNSDCRILIKINSKKGRTPEADMVANLERNCVIDSMNIGDGEFRLWKKGGGF